eukprot:CAMPEP_0174376020 /NCGR_PEP_ID=MMETSP0811_2-20130205/116687_1 /TAXON_ID=73025 ORGANISM="Eutreptiella gymnastica-like, Strain CCMP1594" /NCGR_SAMPLE_ID=MMETSP0811_2 /ASSEMBLY_ACC=CAM_ASM_000667 /LENGTH=47 /DNA_ID= /DNA_START= /DNA_END= /DNA_ORIENTATION=
MTGAFDLGHHIVGRVAKNVPWSHVGARPLIAVLAKVPGGGTGAQAGL